jgi:7-cyano-7-deazaguanine synthase in queuosine biosynthesis
LWTNTDPDLGQLGNVPTANREAVWLATAAFLADRTIPRLTGWQREIEIAVPLGESWLGVRAVVEALLSFLTSDTWILSAEPVPPVFDEEVSGFAVSDPNDVVCLFSGGSDSLCGVVDCLVKGRRVTVVSHWDWSVHAGIQTRVVAELEKVFGAEISQVQIHLGRKAQQIGGATFPDETSRRSRSLLFIALGLAVAASHSLPLVVAENGFTSLNPPLAPERIGALSTRTTHPKFLEHLRNVLDRVHAHAEFSTPFDRKTKGEMFSSVAGALGPDIASELLTKTHSCSHARFAGMFGLSPETHCGVCLGCLVRRGAFVSAGLNDGTIYLATHLPEPQRKEFLESLARVDVEVARYAKARVLGPADILSMDLPDDQDLDEALALIQRGFAELGSLKLP